MKTRAQVSFRDSIATRILLVVLGLHLLIASAAALGQLWMNYRYQRSSIAQDLMDFERTFGEGLAVNLWNMDEEGLKAGVEGILKSPSIVGVIVANEDEATVAIGGGVVDEDGDRGNTGFHISLSGVSDEEKIIYADESSRYEMFEHQFPLVYTQNGRSIPQGRATLFSDSSVIYRRMKVEFVMIIVTVALTLLVFFLALLWAVNRYLRQPLGVLTRATAGISLDNLGAFSVDTNTYGNNEIKQLEETMTTMVSDLYSAVSKQQESEELYRNLVQHLSSAVVVHAADTRILLHNQTALSLLGLSEGQMVGKVAMDPAWCFIREDLTPLPTEEYPVSRVIATGAATRDLVLGIIRPITDDCVWVLVNAFPEFDANGQLCQVVVTFVDVTARKKTEERIRAEREFADTALNSQLDTFFLFDPVAGKAIRWNRAFQESSGYTDKEIADMPAPASYYSPNDLDRAAVFTKEVLREGTGTIELELVRKDGRKVPTEYRVSVINDTQGEPQYLISIGRDIGERKLADEKLKESEETFRSLFEKGPIGVAYHRMVYDQSGKAVDYFFIDANESFKELTGVNPVGQLVTKAFPGIEEDPFDWIGTYGEVAKTGKELRFQQHLAANDRWYNCVAYQNKPGHFVVAFIEVTDQKRAELALRDTESRQAAMITNIADVIAIIDENGINRYKSPNIEHWFGWRQEELVGRSTFDNVHPDDMERTQGIFAGMLGSPRATATGECRYHCKDGSYKWIEFTGVNLQADPVIKGVLLNYHDITERKQAEEREAELRRRLERAARMESLGVLAGGVAHDLNNVLGPMLILPELIKEYVEEHSDPTDPDYADTIESLETIEESTQRAASVVSDLVVMGRRGQFQKTSMNVNAIVAQLLESKQVTTIQTARRDVHIVNHLCEGPIWCMGSESRLLRVLANLVGNAAEAIDGQGDVIVSTGRQMVVEPLSGFEVVPVGDYVTIEVTDTGCGMDAKTMARSFEPFFSMKAPSERSGSGLGLSVVHGLVKDHEGFLDLKSTQGKGTTFTIYLPAVKAGASSEEAKRASLPRGNERILVVDDEVVQQRIAGKWLKKLGYSATSASSGAEAVALFEAAKQAGEPAPFDLVMMDMVMVGMDGVAASKEIRHIYSEQKLLIVSGHAPDNLDAEAKALGISWLTKPYTAAGLAHALRANL
jgi:PAS domain S-box-containing protein